MLNQSADLDRLFHALSDPARRAMVERLSRGPASVSELARDSFQLASAATTILYPVKAGVMSRIGPEEVRQRYG
jgi:hypothetical protein